MNTMTKTVSCYRADKEILHARDRDNGKTEKIFNKDFAALIID